jgi:hypothetical protein
LGLQSSSIQSRERLLSEWAAGNTIIICHDGRSIPEMNARSTILDGSTSLSLEVKLMRADRTF